MNLPVILTTPIVRTDIKAAKAFLAWLAASPYQFHLDEDAKEVPAFTPEVADFLNARRDEALLVLGYSGLWNAYPWNEEAAANLPADLTLEQAAEKILACVDKPGGTIRSITANAVIDLRAALKAHKDRSL